MQISRLMVLFDVLFLFTDSSGCFSVFCLFKMGTQVIDSSVVEVEKNSLDVSFPDKLIL